MLPTRRPTASQLRQLFNNSQSIFMFHFSRLRTSFSKLILLIQQPSNHEYAHPPLRCIQLTRQKIKDTHKNQQKLVTTANTTHHEYTSQDVHTIRSTYPYFPKPEKYFNSTSPLLVLFTLEKHNSFSDSLI